MSDTISRQAAIDAYILHTMDYLVGEKPRRAFTEVLRELPSAQPEIIRCKDCKHKNVYRFPPKYDARDYCEKQGKVVDVADFCSWAERREE